MEIEPEERQTNGRICSEIVVYSLLATWFNCLPHANIRNILPLCKQYHIHFSPIFQVAKNYKLTSNVRQAKNLQFTQYLNLI